MSQRKAHLDDGREVEFYVYSILVSVETRHGRRKLHTFFSEFDANTGEHISAWILTTPPSHKQAAEKRRLNADAADNPLEYTRFMTRRTPRRQIGIELSRELETGTIRLAPGVDVSATTFAVVLDAIHSSGKRELDLNDVQVVVSHLGGWITQLHTLDETERRHATPALYSEILRRCTSV